ncbi:MAG: UPF0262 family protein [Alphaproteobacteria bacterium]|nr:UPF0262 family protein [Alphaproteobacteria bacterium]
MTDSANRIAQVTLDEKTVIHRKGDVEHERAVAIADLLEQNSFAPKSGAAGPFNLHLGIAEERLVLDVRDGADRPLERVTLPLAPFRGLVKDYFLVCESYYSAVKTADPARIEAIDMGRRSLHNEGSELLRDNLADQVDIDFDTARRLFTLLCVLHIR